MQASTVRHVPQFGIGGSSHGSGYGPGHPLAGKVESFHMLPARDAFMLDGNSPHLSAISETSREGLESSSGDGRSTSSRSSTSGSKASSGVQIPNIPCQERSQQQIGSPKRLKEVLVGRPSCDSTYEFTRASGKYNRCSTTGLVDVESDAGSCWVAEDPTGRGVATASWRSVDEYSTNASRLTISDEFGTGCGVTMTSGSHQQRTEDGMYTACSAVGDRRGRRYPTRLSDSVNVDTLETEELKKSAGLQSDSVQQVAHGHVATATFSVEKNSRVALRPSATQLAGAVRFSSLCTERTDTAEEGNQHVLHLQAAEYGCVPHCTGGVSAYSRAFQQQSDQNESQRGSQCSAADREASGKPSMMRTPDFRGSAQIDGLSSGLGVHHSGAWRLGPSTITGGVEDGPSKLEKTPSAVGGGNNRETALADHPPSVTNPGIKSLALKRRGPVRNLGPALRVPVEMKEENAAAQNHSSKPEVERSVVLPTDEELLERLLQEDLERERRRKANGAKDETPDRSQLGQPPVETPAAQGPVNTPSQTPVNVPASDRGSTGALQSRQLELRRQTPHAEERSQVADTPKDPAAKERDTPRVARLPPLGGVGKHLSHNNLPSSQAALSTPSQGSLPSREVASPSLLSTPQAPVVQLGLQGGAQESVHATTTPSSQVKVAQADQGQRAPLSASALMKESAVNPTSAAKPLARPEEERTPAQLLPPSQRFSPAAVLSASGRQQSPGIAVEGQRAVSGSNAGAGNVESAGEVKGRGGSVSTPARSSMVSPVPAAAKADSSLNPPDSHDKGANQVRRKVFEDELNIWVNNKRYQKIQQIGKGGSSKVYKVIAPNRQIYALKRIHLSGREDPEIARGFLDEINLLKLLVGKRNIIQLMDSEVVTVGNSKLIFMVMELGEIDLQKKLQRMQEASKSSGKPMKLDDNFLRLNWQNMLEAVHTIHEERIVHSDLKPANFLFVESTLKLIDFGIAKTIQSDTTNIHRDTNCGTVNYMAPECLTVGPPAPDAENNEKSKLPKIGRPSDIWSLGCILYQMVYGQPPFAYLQRYANIIQAIVSPSYEIKYPPLANPSLMDTIKRCLERNPKLRITIPELLDHPFLHPDAVAPQPMPAATDTKAQSGLSPGQLQDILAEVMRIAAAAPPGSVDVAKITAEIFAQLQAQGFVNTKEIIDKACANIPKQPPQPPKAPAPPPPPPKLPPPPPPPPPKIAAKPNPPLKLGSKSGAAKKGGESMGSIGSKLADMAAEKARRMAMRRAEALERGGSDESNKENVGGKGSTGVDFRACLRGTGGRPQQKQFGNSLADGIDVDELRRKQGSLRPVLKDDTNRGTKKMDGVDDALMRKLAQMRSHQEDDNTATISWEG